QNAKSGLGREVLRRGGHVARPHDGRAMGLHIVLRSANSLSGVEHARPCLRISIVGNRQCCDAAYQAWSIAGIFPAATKQWQSPGVPEHDSNMRQVTIRPEVWMAYEDHWFGEPWTTPETVVMVHRNSESSRACICSVPPRETHYRV